MKKLLIIILSAFTAIFSSCSKQVTDNNDYDKYLGFETFKTELKAERNEIDFWKERVQKSNNQSPYYSKLASAQKRAFELNADVNFLNMAVKNIEKANDLVNYGDAGTLRTLAHSYISQHRFKEAEKCLKMADSLGAEKSTTEKMLFDINMEIGNYEEAKSFIRKNQHDMDFEILIRKAKFFDHQGNIKKAINLMEMAKNTAENSKDEDLKEWVYTNLADFYGHNGQIKESYQHYLKALAINPNSAYALKGIAWIVYSHEKNTVEALRIIESIEKVHPTPDLVLLKSEIYEYNNDVQEAKKFENIFLQLVKSPDYGDMYNTYIVELESAENALEIAKKEVKNRPVTSSYDLFAYSLVKNNKPKEALKVMNEKVIGKTSEPLSLYHQAEIFKANGMNSAAQKIKVELKEAYYELGPNLAAKIDKI